MPDQDTKLTRVEAPVEAKPTMNLDRIAGTLLWVVPLILVLVIIVLTLLGPAYGTAYSNITPSL